MKKILSCALFCLIAVSYGYGQTHIGAKFYARTKGVQPDSGYSNDLGIRGALVAPDLDKDGKPELFITDYTKNGQVHAFQSVGNDSLEWIWSWRSDSTGSSIPRTIRFGDLDGDGRGEVIFPHSKYGILIFEWDGKVGSHNFGKKPSAIVPINVPYGVNFGALAGVANEAGLQTTVEQFEIADVDGDGQQELLLPKNIANTTVNDDVLIISADGQWDFEDQGFASFAIEGSTNRQASVKFGGGSPYAVHPADLNGDGKPEIVCHNWNYGDYYVMKSTGPNTYVMADTSAANTKRYYQQTLNPNDCVAIFGGMVADLDKDGKQEVYFPWYSSVTGDAQVGNVWMVSYKKTDNVLEADSTHSFKIASDVGVNTSGTRISLFGGTVGDLNRNGKLEILVGCAYPVNVTAIEYKGTGAITDPASYTKTVYYKGESDIWGTITYRDSAGVKDTTKTIGEGFVSKMTAPIDFDGDGRQEVFLPYQSLVDSTTVTWKHYNAATSAFVTDSTKKIANPKRWAVRALEADIAGAVDSRDAVVIMPEDYQLNQNFPNPFNPSTQITFTLPLTKKISMKVYDVLGKEVRTLVSNQEFTKGTHSITWNGRDNAGISVASGIYIYKMTAGNIEKSMKMMLMK